MLILPSFKKGQVEEIKELLQLVKKLTKMRSGTEAPKLVRKKKMKQILIGLSLTQKKIEKSSLVMSLKMNKN